MNELLLGRRIKELRRERGYTLEEVAKRTGFSKSLLSKIENSQVSPPIATLSRIASALDVAIGFFFEEEARQDRAIFVPKSQRQRIDRRDLGPEYGYEHLAFGSTMPRLMEPFVIFLEPDSQEVATLFEHPGEEFIMVLQGEMEFLFGSTSYRMAEGDSLYFDARVPHGPKQLHGRPVKYLAIFTNR
ncbi:MAG: helix-turn-helix transcriptional regulator [Fimbriimonadaceae bacterium]|nr:helix-turn-helix transcriptional regulator [Fimbriimonadaceae bacterium]